MLTRHTKSRKRAGARLDVWRDRRVWPVATPKAMRCLLHWAKPNPLWLGLSICVCEALDSLPTTILFGEDIEDPKGGVFGFTKGLSTRHPGRVINSPLAEATIRGHRRRASSDGYRPIFELQFIDFAIPALNQLINQVATCAGDPMAIGPVPLFFMLPCGAYLPAGGPWHSQSNEAFWTHIPGFVSLSLARLKIWPEFFGPLCMRMIQRCY